MQTWMMWLEESWRCSNHISNQGVAVIEVSISGDGGGGGYSFIQGC